MTTNAIATTPELSTCRCGGVARYWILAATRPVAVACVICADRASPYTIVRRMDPARPGIARDSSSLAFVASKKFVLEGTTVREAAISEWAAWLEANMDACLLGCTIVAPGSHVRTEFVGLATCLFETMIFGGTLHGDQTRYRTYDDAIAGHLSAVARAREAFAEHPTQRPSLSAIDLTTEALEE
jgi:hypothetical protein